MSFDGWWICVKLHDFGQVFFSLSVFGFTLKKKKKLLNLILYALA